MAKKPKIIVIVGPNASGKSELGVKIARKINGEIISADSRQVYKKLNIGSGKVGGEWKIINGQKKFVYKNISHYCIDIANPKKVFTADDYRKCAQKATADILSRGKTPIIVGGTGFYIDAALGRIQLGGVPPNQKLRKKLSKKSALELLKMLKKLDPTRAKTVEQKNPRRMIRAIEIANGKKRRGVDFAGFEASEHGSCRRRDREASTLSPAAGLGEESKINTAALVWLGIKRLPKELQKRIRARLKKRLPGIICEVKKLRQGGLSWKRLYDLGLEYRYASLYLRGKLSKEDMTRQLETAINHYAKRQMTYFKKNKEIRWISNGKKEKLF